ncbi:LuxR C-terminal-related transcriptional regulator [Streptomyces sp. NPDC046862]|uniref:LuxR C-terminal-related transcriptional regulator n=1 Tax=Streptomyces sp. NPDC046862 TaxID=3154603 RepID=UPI0034546FD0
MTAPVVVGPSSSSGGPVPSEDWDELLADLGDRVRAERQARGWSQRELGRRSGLGKRAIESVDEGRGSLRGFVVACTALGVSPAHLLSEDWRLPTAEPVPSLSGRQVEVLRAAASGDSLTVVADRLGIEARAVSSHLSRIYQRLGVAHLPRGERRSAAARVAMQHGLFDAA